MARIFHSIAAAIRGRNTVQPLGSAAAAKQSLRPATVQSVKSDGTIDVVVEGFLYNCISTTDQAYEVGQTVWVQMDASGRMVSVGGQ